MPLAVAAGVPASVAVPAVPALKLTPEGSGPDSDSVGVGLPAAVTLNVPGVPAVKVVDAADVMARAPLCTVRVNDWATGAPTWLLAVRVKGKVPTLAALRVPAMVAVPFGPGVKVTPDGRGPTPRASLLVYRSCSPRTSPAGPA